MRRDYAQGVLPLEDGRYLPVGGPPVTQVTWGGIIDGFKAVIITCVSGSSPRMNGWALVGDIVVAFWPRNSQIDQLYGFFTTGVSSRLANETTTNTTGTGSGAGPVLRPNGGEVPSAALSISFRSVSGMPTPTASYAYEPGTAMDLGGR